MNVNIQGAPIYFEIPILGGIPITATLVVSWGVMLVLTLVCIWLTHDLKVRNISKRQAIAEKIVITAQNFVRNNMGEAWMRYMPFVSTIFAMSIFSSLSSLVGLWPPTADVSTTLAWGHCRIRYYYIYEAQDQRPSWLSQGASATPSS